jgi:hypothetical protein
MRRDRIAVMFEALASFRKERQKRQVGISLRLGALSSSCVNADNCAEIELGYRESVDSGLSMDRDGSGINL